MVDKSKESAKIYGKIASLYYENFNQPSEHLDQFVKLLPPKARVLDVGCGPGVDSAYLYSKGCSVIGVDLSKEMIKIAQNKFKGIDFRVGDMRKLEFSQGSFDGIIAAYSLFHLRTAEIKEVVSRSYSFLKKGGMLYVALQSGASQEVEVVQPLDLSERIFMNILSKKEVEMLLKNAGFSIVSEFKRPSKSTSEHPYTKLFILVRK